MYNTIEPTQPLLNPLIKDQFSFHWALNDQWHNKNYVLSSIFEHINQIKLGIGKDEPLNNIVDILQVIPDSFFKDKEFLLEANFENLDFMSALIKYSFINSRAISSICFILENLPLSHIDQFTNFWNNSLKSFYLYLKTPWEVIEQNFQNYNKYISLDNFKLQQETLKPVIDCIEYNFIHGHGFSHFQSVFNLHNNIEEKYIHWKELSKINNLQSFQYYIFSSIFVNNISKDNFDYRMLYYYFPENLQSLCIEHFTSFIKDKAFEGKSNSIFEYSKEDTLPLSYYYVQDTVQLDCDKLFFYIYSFLNENKTEDKHYIFSNSFREELLNTFFNNENSIENIALLLKYLWDNKNNIWLEEDEYLTPIVKFIIQPEKRDQNFFMKLFNIDHFWDIFIIEHFIQYIPLKLRSEISIQKTYFEQILFLNESLFEKPFDFSILDMEKDLHIIRNIVRFNPIFSNEQYKNIHNDWLNNLHIITYSDEVSNGRLKLSENMWKDIISNKELFEDTIQKFPSFFNHAPINLFNKEQAFNLVTTQIKKFEANEQFQLNMEKIKPYLDDTQYCLQILSLKLSFNLHIQSIIPIQNWSDYDFCLAVFDLIDQKICTINMLPQQIGLYFKSYHITSHYKEAFQNMYLEKKLSSIIKNKPEKNKGKL